MEHGPIFMPEDPVFYTGQKFKMELTSKEGKPQKGYIHATVTNQPGMFVVWFPDTKDSDSYVMSAQVLSKVKPAEHKVKHEGGPEIMPRRRKKEDE